MKCLILAALIGFCAASALYPGGHKLFFVDDENVMLHGLYGNYYTFTHYPGQHYFDIVINGVDTPMKKIRIDGQTCQVHQLEGFEHQQYPGQWFNKVFTKGDLFENHFFNILKQYQGYMDEAQYAQFMHNIELHVQEGKICHVIYHLLTYLDKVVNEDFFQKYIYQYKYQHQYPVGQYFDKYHYGKYNYDDVYKYGFYPYSEQYYNYPSYHKYFSYPYYKGNYYGKYQTQQQPWEKYEFEYGHHYGYPSTYYGKSHVVDSMTHQQPWEKYGYGYEHHYEYPSTYYGKSHVVDYLAGHQYPWTWYNQYNQGYGYGSTYGKQYGYGYEY